MINWMQNQDQQLWDISNVWGQNSLPVTEFETLNGLQTFLGWQCASFDPSTMQVLEWLDVAINTSADEQNLVEGNH